MTSTVPDCTPQITELSVPKEHSRTRRTHSPHKHTSSTAPALGRAAPRTHPHEQRPEVTRGQARWLACLPTAKDAVLAHVGNLSRCRLPGPQPGRGTNRPWS